MKKIFIIVIFFTYSILHAEDFKTLHNFSSGDVLSADMFNELFTYIKESREAIDYDYLIGSWACTSMHTTGIGTTTVSGWSRDSENLYDKLSSTITFSDDGDNTYSLTTSSPNPFMWNTAGSHSAAFSTNLNTFWLQTLQTSGSLISTLFNLSKFSKNKFFNASPIIMKKPHEIMKIGRALHNILDESARNRTMGDVPICTMLSGGIDSLLTTFYVFKNLYLQRNQRVILLSKNIL